MGKIVVSENVTLDGVIQDPAGDEGFRAGGWVGLIGNSPQLAKLALDEALAAGAFLLGRRSYQWLAARRPSRSGELADRLNSLPKYVAAADALTVLIGTVAVGMPFVLTLYAQQVLGYSALKFGVSTVVLALGATAGALTGQGAVLKAGFRPVAAAGLALMAAGSLVLTQVSVHGRYFPDIFAGLLLCGLGIGLAFVTATVAALAGVAGHEAGLASGLSNTALQIGTALGAAIVTTVAVSRSRGYLAAHAGANPLAAVTQGYQTAFLACAVLAGTGLALALLLPGRPPNAAPEAAEPVLAASAADRAGQSQCRGTSGETA